VNTQSSLQNFQNVVSSEVRKKIVNYVWVRKDVFKSNINDPQSHLCGVPLEDIDMALSNAAKYPNAQFYIWLDYDEIDDLSLYFVEHLIYAEGLKNVKVCNLRDIEDYASSPVFEIVDGRHKTDVYPRADFARLLVVCHILEQAMDNTDVFYADFDVDDVLILDTDINQILGMKGIVFTHTDDDPIENGYMGVSSIGIECFREILRETMVSALCNDKGYEPLMETVKKIHGNVGEVVSEKAVLKPRGYEIPKKSFYSDLGIC